MHFWGLTGGNRKGLIASMSTYIGDREELFNPRKGEPLGAWLARLDPLVDLGGGGLWV